METDKGKLRQQILAGESDINTLSGFAASGKLQFPTQGLPSQMYPGGYPNGGYRPNSQQYDNHDLLTPVSAPGAYSGNPQGRASITSTSSRSMQRFFRRKGDDNGAFDEENGADISDVAAEMSFADIAHIRGNGRYNTSASQALDTLPIIPVLGSAPTNGNPKNLNNIQYRKYMNQQKKMSLATNARAMSLATQNQTYLMTSDPRSMSFGGPQDGRTNSFGPQDGRTMSIEPQNGRAQSLGGQMNQMPIGPRAMSLNSNMMLRSPGPTNRRGPPMNMNANMGQNMNQNMGKNLSQNINPNLSQNINPNLGQNMNPMYNQMYPNQNGPRAQSLQTGNPMNQQFRGPPPSNRNNSLGGIPGGMSSMAGGISGPMPAPMGHQIGNGNQGYSPMGQRTPLLSQRGAFPPQKQMGGRSLMQQPYNGQRLSDSQLHFESLEHLHVRPPQQSSNSNSNSNSTSQDSLMNVREEDEDLEVLKASNKHLHVLNDRSLPLAEAKLDEENGDDVDDDLVYKFDNDRNSPQLSKKSTVKKSNSMRVRRLDLFKSTTRTTAEEAVVDDEQSEPSFNLQAGGDRLSKLTVDENDEEASRHIALQAGKLGTLGATTKDKDVFVTASEFRSPRKKPPPPDNDEQGKDQSKKPLSETITEVSAPPSPNILMISQPPSMAAKEYYQLLEGLTSKDSFDSKKRPIQLKSLVANTAFNNFRTASLSSQNRRGLESRGEAEQPHIEKSFSKFDESPLDQSLCLDQPKHSSDALEQAQAHDVTLTKAILDEQNSSSTSEFSKEYVGPIVEDESKDGIQKQRNHNRPLSQVLTDDAKAQTAMKPEINTNLKNLEELRLKNGLNSFAPPRTERGHSETESQSSEYSTDTAKQRATDVLVSPTSEQHSHSSETKKKLVHSEDDLNGFEAQEDPSVRPDTTTKDDSMKVGDNEGFREWVRAKEPALESNNTHSSPFSPPHSSQSHSNNKNEEMERSHDFEFADNISHAGSTSDSTFDFNSGRTPETRNFTDRSSGLIDVMRTPEQFSRKALGTRALEKTIEHNLTPLIQKRISSSNSELKLQGLLPSSGLLKGTDTEGHHGPVVDQQDAKRKSRTSSISTKSRSFIKRLSMSGSKKTLGDELSVDEPNSAYGLRVVSSSSTKELRKPLVFTKEELAIMTCNNDLQNELQMVTSELAKSIKRELVLESHLRNGKNGVDPSDGQTYEEMSTERAGIISDLLEKLNNERRLRFISEEHAILSEHGQSPSALKLDYEKNEIYKQLLAKNDLVNQLQDKLDELENQGASDSGRGLLHKYNDLLKENSELRYKLENALANGEKRGLSFSQADTTNEYEQAQIISLRTQRDELREMLTKLTSSQNTELKIAQERIKTLEDKLQKVNMINDKLSRRLDRGGELSKGNEYSHEAMFTSGRGGKLLGLDVVSPRKKFYD